MILNFVVASVLLWLGFIAVMQVVQGVQRKEDLDVKQKIAVVLFVAGDVFYNYTYAAILFLELGSLKRRTLTARLKHYLREQPESWRGKIAYFMCKYMISPWDWDHCGLGLGNKPSA